MGRTLVDDNIYPGSFGKSEEEKIRSGDRETEGEENVRRKEHLPYFCS